MPRTWRVTPLVVLVVFAVLLLGVVLFQALAADRTPLTSPRSAAEQGQEDAQGDKNKQGDKDKQGKKNQQAEKAARAPEVEVTLTGALGSRTTAGGDTEYTLTVGSNVLTLDAGPPWFYKHDNPLAPFVGKTVTVTGEQPQGETTVDVWSVDGTTIRAAGRPPWAGGPNRLGATGDGTSCWPPGHCKDAAGTQQNPASPSP
jgi:hypothetical protein